MAIISFLAYLYTFKAAGPLYLRVLAKTVLYHILESFFHQVLLKKTTNNAQSMVTLGDVINQTEIIEKPLLLAILLLSEK